MKLQIGLRNSIFITSLFLFCIFIVSGCSSTESATVEEGPKPITLKIHFAPDEKFINAFIKPAEEEFPYITFEHVEGDLRELIKARKMPDILWFGNKESFKNAAKLQLTYDMTELIDRSGFDLSRFSSDHLAEWQTISDGELWALPITIDRYALMYNRDIFDLFGVEYPKDGMSWEEVVELARKVTGKRDGVEYQGLYMPKLGAPITWSVGNFIDPETDEPLWTENEEVKRYFQLYRTNYSISGNPYIPEHWEEGGWPELFAQGRLAMVAHWFMPPSEEANINWDIATYPEADNGVPGGGWAMGISSSSVHKEEVMKVFDFWYAEEQLLNNNFIDPLSLPYAHLYEDGPALEKAIGDVWEGRNVEALFSLPVAQPLHQLSEYDNDDIIYEALYEYIQDRKLDLNKLLQQKHELEIARIEEDKAKKSRMAGVR